MNNDLKERILGGLSTRPGVYQMYNAKGQLLYVGKARNLRARVKSYFQRILHHPKTAVMMSQVVDIKITITSTENEALLLEANLIKQYRPRYNILLRDDKSYPYLFLSLNSEFPRLDFYRGVIKHTGGRYFGPYPHAGAVRENLSLIQKLFKLRQCSDTFFKHRSRPCLQYQINRCTAPCVGYVSAQAYQEQVHHALLFLEGKSQAVIEDLIAKMEWAANNLEYEGAANYRDQIYTLRQLLEKQAIMEAAGNLDIIGYANSLGHIAIVVVFVRGGRLIGDKAFFLETPLDENVANTLAAFTEQYYLSAVHENLEIDTIILQEKIADRQWLENALSETLTKKIKIIDAHSRPYQHWQAIAKTNAENVLSQHLAAKKTMYGKLEALQAELHLPNMVKHIECFDVSHTQGESTVASCVVFNEHGAVKKDYRRFNIKQVTPGDDYAALRQALIRRYTRLKSEEMPLPDLLIIDGGQGQLKQAVEVLEELQISGITLMAVAKGPSRQPGKEQLWLVGSKKTLQLAKDSIALHLIQQVRDEAHRFAIVAHRKQRDKKRQQSLLEEIEGVGPKKRRDLLSHFGGRQGLSTASLEEIAKVTGISLNLAQRIYDYFH